MLCCGYTLTDFPISIRLTSLALWQSDDCPSASKAALMNMDKYFIWIHYERLHTHNKAKHNKTVCIFLGIYCIGPSYRNKMYDGITSSTQSASLHKTQFAPLTNEHFFREMSAICIPLTANFPRYHMTDIIVYSREANKFQKLALNKLMVRHRHFCRRAFCLMTTWRVPSYLGLTYGNWTQVNICEILWD